MKYPQYTQKPAKGAFFSFIFPQLFPKHENTIWEGECVMHSPESLQG